MTEKLLSVREEQHNKKRRLSNHVVTRVYRPPEVILLEKKYRTSVDIWSAGCVVAEVINKQVDYKDMKA